MVKYMCVVIAGDWGVGKTQIELLLAAEIAVISALSSELPVSLASLTIAVLTACMYFAASVRALFLLDRRPAGFNGENRRTNTHATATC